MGVEFPAGGAAVQVKTEVVGQRVGMFNSTTIRPYIRGSGPEWSGQPGGL